MTYCVFKDDCLVREEKCSLLFLTDKTDAVRDKNTAARRLSPLALVISPVAVTVFCSRSFKDVIKWYKICICISWSQVT